MIRVKTTGSAETFAKRAWAALGPALQRAFDRMGLVVVGELSVAVVETLTKNPTGALARSFKHELRGGSGTPELVVGSPQPYAEIQDTGGTIYPKRARRLAVPLPGVPRGMGPREWPTPLVLIKGRVLAETRGKRVIPRFVLKQSVTIPGTRYVEKAMDSSRDALKEVLGEEVAAALREIAAATGGALNG